jgi:hypothetical protein
MAPYYFRVFLRGGDEPPGLFFSLRTIGVAMVAANSSNYFGQRYLLVTATMSIVMPTFLLPEEQQPFVNNLNNMDIGGVSIR